MTISAALRLLAQSTFSALFGALSVLAIAAPARAQVVEIVKDFEVAGTYPMASLTLGADGFFYGTTYKGGEFDEGTVFKIAANGSNFSVLKSFRCGVADNGCLPLAGLVQASDGYLYGTTSLGGASDEGTVFRIAPEGTSFAVLKSFQCGLQGDGCSPQNGLIQANNGMLFGTTAFGGSGGGGTIFKLAPNGSGFAVLRSLQCDDPTSSCHPAGNLLQASDGFLYGTSYHGGAHDQGSVFKIATNGSGFALLKSFQCAVTNNGCMPLAGLIQANNGMLYGTTQLGGAVDEGTLFKIATDGTNFAVIRSFQCGQATSGCLPVAGVVQLGDGNLYGTTTFDGANTEGALYRIALDGTNFTVLDLFACNGDDGCKPQAQLTLAHNGYLYSTTSTGGKVGGGTIFRFPAPTTPAVAAIPASIKRSEFVTVSWSGIANLTAQDWIALYSPSSAVYTYLTSVHLNCSNSAGEVKCNFLIPSNVASGTYQIRLLRSADFQLLATSKDFHVETPLPSSTFLRKGRRK